MPPCPLLGLIGSRVPFLLLGCDGGPSRPPIAQCERNSTADLHVRNLRSFSIDVVLDGARVASLAPSETYSVTVASGQHTIETFVTNVGFVACTRATPNLAQCSTFTFTC